MSGEDIIKIIILAVMTFLSAYFSATETAFSSVNKIRIKNLASSGNKRAGLVLELLDNYDKILSTILIGNNIVNIASASLATTVFVEYFGNAGVTISTVVMTILVLIFGEITPKSLAKESPESFAMAVAPMIRLISLLLMPLTYLFSLWKILISKFIKVNNSKGITEEELITMVEEATQDGEIQKYEGDLIRSAIEFNDLDVTDVLTPRTELVAIDETNTMEEIRELFAENGYSRLPVYRDTIDSILGVIHLKDFFNRSTDNIADIMKPVVFTTDKVKISRLLQLLPEHRSHLAVVTDEYGGTLGIVTLEDIIEELVGEIWDEHDDIIKDFEKLSEKEYRINCSASLDKMFRLLGITEEAEATTVNGWVMEQLGTVPNEGDTFVFQNLHVKVLSTNARRAVEIQVLLIEEEQKER